MMGDGEFDDVNDPSPEAPPIALAPPRRPRFRRRLAFGPPILLLAAGSGLLTYRATHPDWQGLASLGLPSSRQASKPRPVAIAAVPKPGPKPAPILVKAISEPVASPSTPKIEIASKVAEARPIAGPPARPEPPRPEATPGIPAPAVAINPAIPAPGLEIKPETVVVAASPEPKPADPVEVAAAAQAEQARKAREAREDIEREAQRLRIERERNEALKPALAAQEEKHEAEHKVESLKKAFDAAEADRGVFLREIREALGRSGNRAGPEIRGILARHDMAPHPVILQAVHQALTRAPGKLDRARSIQISRSRGLPEAAIVDALSVAEWKNHVARNGPKTEDEAIVRAARAVLAVPLLPPTARAPGARRVQEGNPPR